MRLPDGRNVAACQAVHGERTLRSGLRQLVAGWEQQQLLLAWMIPLVVMVHVQTVQTADPLGVRVF